MKSLLNYMYQNEIHVHLHVRTNVVISNLFLLISSRSHDVFLTTDTSSEVTNLHMSAELPVLHMSMYQ